MGRTHNFLWANDDVILMILRQRALPSELSIKLAYSVSEPKLGAGAVAAGRCGGAGINIKFLGPSPLRNDERRQRTRLQPISFATATDWTTVEFE
jgi:hypothetical protein